MATGGKAPDVLTAHRTLPSDSDAERRRGQGCIDALVELLGVFTHDLSNPLQSLTVLLELGLDELPPESEERTRLLHSLQATERMREMIRDFGAVARAGRDEAVTTCGELLRRNYVVLRRRLERHRIRVEADWRPLEHAEVAREFGFGVLNVLLGVVASAARSAHVAFQLDIRGFIVSGPESKGCVELTLSGHRHAEQPSTPVPIGSIQIERAQAVLWNTDIVLSLTTTHSVRFHFPLG